MLGDEKKTVLVLGTNAGQSDLIRHMKALDWHVVACSGREGEPGAALADRFERLDIRNTDAVHALARTCKADLVYSVSSDIAMVQAVKVSEALGTPYFFGSGLVDLFNSKQGLRQKLNEVGLSKVSFAHVTAPGGLKNWDDFPCVVKPTDAQGQRGVQVVRNSREMLPALEKACSLSSDNSALVESYLEGVEISANVLVQNHDILINEISERLVHKHVGFGIPSGHLIPPYNISQADISEARQLVVDVVNLLDVADGCLYFQMKVTPNGIKIIEIAPRLDGCHMWRCVKAATGMDFLAATIDVLLNKTPVLEPVRLSDGTITELMFQQLPAGKPFKQSDFPVPADASYHEYRYGDGNAITRINGHLEVVGYYVRATDVVEAVKYQHYAPTQNEGKGNAKVGTTA